DLLTTIKRVKESMKRRT
uniref:Cupiennin-7a n=1 Tax=Cupiennius salei TaxID=6928 RepID=TXC7A_CUPSA|nr:RecName: Full=Cupiennin-7a; Short=Cu-7a; AltName: Full=Short cationic peptide-5a; Short=SCP-5a [Cupiennius salei]